MGSTYIAGFLEMGTPLETALRIHLSSNHYPPVHPDFIPVCQWAIVVYNEGGDLSAEITMPNGVVKTAWQVIDGLHLECFLNSDDDDYQEDDDYDDV